MKAKNIVLVGLFVAITSICSVITIPIGSVPISLSLLAVYLSAMILGSKLGALSQIIYIALGVIGVPVFSNFRSGFQMLAGPTGGYLIGYIFAAFVIGFVVERQKDLKMRTVVPVILVGQIICYTIGTLQLALVANLSIWAALTAGVFPFIVFDLCKGILAAYAGIKIRNALKNANFITM